LHNAMLVLLDRNFDSAALLHQLAATQAHLLVRANHRKLPVLRRYPDGSWLSQIGATHVRVVQAEITIATPPPPGGPGQTPHPPPRRAPHRRLPAGHHPARPPPLSGVGTAGPVPPALGNRNRLLGVEASILGGRVLRARTPHGIDQELYALLACYQILRLAMTDVTNTQPTIDPDRASFT